MVSLDEARNAVGIVGDILSFVLFLSPVSTFVSIWKKKDVENFSPIPYLATTVNCMLWVFYGLPMVSHGNILVSTINGVGVLLEGIYLTIFFIYSRRHLRLNVLKILTLELVFMGGVVTGVILGARTHQKRRLIVGSLSVFFGISMYSSPLSIVRLVIKTKSVEYMPFYLSLAGFLNGLCWTAYALIPLDIFVMIPNGLGALLGAAQLLIYFYYARRTPGQEAKSEVQLAEASSQAPPNGHLATEG